VHRHFHWGWGGILTNHYDKKVVHGKYWDQWDAKSLAAWPTFLGPISIWAKPSDYSFYVNQIFIHGGPSESYVIHWGKLTLSMRTSTFLGKRAICGERPVGIKSNNRKLSPFHTPTARKQRSTKKKRNLGSERPEMYKTISENSDREPNYQLIFGIAFTKSSIWASFFNSGPNVKL